MAKKRRVERKIIRDKIYAPKGAIWTVRHGQLNAGRGGGTARLFRVVGEKLPFEALPSVEAFIKKDKKLAERREGVYIAHDSMGCPRYIGRGRIFARLKAHQKAHKTELMYFSFYVVIEKKHEREIETLLIRAAGPLLEFNTQKKRVKIRKGAITDYEPGTFFFERQRKKGKKAKPK